MRGEGVVTTGKVSSAGSDQSRLAVGQQHLSASGQTWGGRELMRHSAFLGSSVHIWEPGPDNWHPAHRVQLTAPHSGHTSFQWQEQRLRRGAQHPSFKRLFATHATSLVAQTVKATACNAGDPDSIPGSGRSPGEGNGNPL